MKILVIQNRMGIGDTVIFLPYIQAISKKFNTPVSILVKKNSKADQYLNQTKYIDKIIFLERDNHKNERHDGLIGSLRLCSSEGTGDKLCLSIFEKVIHLHNQTISVEN